MEYHRMCLNRKVIIASLLILGASVFSGPAYGADSPLALEWERVIGGAADDWGVCVQTTTDGGFIVGGTTHSYGAGECDAYLVKIDSKGEEVWPTARTFGGSMYEVCHWLQETRDGGYILVGATSSFGAGSHDVYVVKTDADGIEQWYRTYGGSGSDMGAYIEATSDGGYIIAGWTHSYSNSDDVYVIKIDVSGNMLWDCRFGGHSWDYASSVREVGDGFIIVGETSSYGTGGDVLWAKIDLNGTLLNPYPLAIGGAGREIGTRLRLSADGQCIVPGWTSSFGAGGWDAYLLKTDLSGVVEWQKAYGGSENDFGSDVIVYGDGGYAVLGYTASSGAGGYDICVVRTNSGGEEIGSATLIGKSGDEYGYCMTSTPDGGLVIAGMTNSEGGGGFDIYVAKLREACEPSGVVCEPGDVVVAGYVQRDVRVYDGETGAYKGVLIPPQPYAMGGLAFGPDGNLYATMHGGDKVVRLDMNTRQLTDFVIGDSGGLDGPAGLTFGPDGDLYVASNHTRQILRYDGCTRTFKEVVPSLPELTPSAPNGVAFGPDGNLYTTWGQPTNKVIRYNMRTGVVDDFVPSVAGELLHPVGLAFAWPQQLYVVSQENDRVITYGAEDGQHVSSIVPTSIPFDDPQWIAKGPEGVLYVNGHLSGNVVRIQIQDGACTEFIKELDHPCGLAVVPPAHCPPVVDAGENVQILSSEQPGTVISGTASDADGDQLEYRWMEAEAVLLDWTAVPETSQCNLELADLVPLATGNHTLTLEVREFGATDSPVSDTMILTVENSPPEAVPAPNSQIVEIGIDPIVVVADVADFDGDMLGYEWKKGMDVLAGGTIATPAGGGAVPIPALCIEPGDPRFPLGTHAIELVVDDGTNTAVSATVTVCVQDSQAPSISPLPSVTILWPPNHELQPVTIVAYAFDNGGGAITLSVGVESSQPPDATADGATIPDYYVDSIDHAGGIIELRLRSERAGTGDGRTYTITITATDESLNSSVAIVTIRAPHDKRKK